MIPFKYVLDFKVPIKTADGQEIIDLAAPSMKRGVDVKVLNYVIVRKNEEMRPDMVAQRYFGTMDNTEMLLKLNGITNPFSIEEGDIIIITDPVSGRNAMNNNVVINKGDVRKQYFQPEKEGKPDPRLKTFEKREKVKPRKAGPALPPNYANPGDKEIDIVGGKIVFGNAVTGGGGATSADMPLEKMKFLESLKNNPDVLKLQRQTAAINKLYDSSVVNTSPDGAKLTNSSGIPNSGLDTQGKLGTVASGNGVTNSSLSKEQLDKLAAEKERKKKKAADALSKVNLSKSDLIAKLVKDVYGTI